MGQCSRIYLPTTTTYRCMQQMYMFHKQIHFGVNHTQSFYNTVIKLHQQPQQQQKQQQPLIHH